MLEVDAERTPWELVLVFVGMTLDLGGPSWPAIRHRLAQGAGQTEDAVDGCVGVGQCAAGQRAIAMTKGTKSALNSWSTPAASVVLGIRRGAAAGADVQWRRRQRAGRAALGR